MTVKVEKCAHCALIGIVGAEIAPYSIVMPNGRRGKRWLHTGKCSIPWHEKYREHMRASRKEAA